MSAFFEAAFSLPTAIFSVLGILMAIYWLTFLFGLFDLEILDGIFDMFGGAAESVGGAVDAVGGAADAVGGAVDGVAGAAEGLGGAADALSSATDGAVEGLVQSADGVGDSGGCLGLGGVPTIITATAFTFFGWLGSYFGSSWIEQMEPAGSMVALAPWAVGGGAVVGSLALTSVSLRPLKKVFRIPEGTGNTELVGKVCTVTTLQVNDRFGQAEVLDEGGTPILIQARSREANTLRRGQKALIFDYDPKSQVFFVAPPRDGVDDAASSGKV